MENELNPSNPITDDRLRNTRNWAAARIGQMSGAEVIVAACDEALAARCAQDLSDETSGGEPMLRGTYACPICGKEYPHEHTEEEQRLFSEGLPPFALSVKVERMLEIGERGPYGPEIRELVSWIESMKAQLARYRNRSAATTGGA